jgi:hypothetical protein
MQYVPIHSGRSGRQATDVTLRRPNVRQKCHTTTSSAAYTASRQSRRRRCSSASGGFSFTSGDITAGRTGRDRDPSGSSDPICRDEEKEGARKGSKHNILPAAMVPSANSGVGTAHGGDNAAQRERLLAS